MSFVVVFHMNEMENVGLIVKVDVNLKFMIEDAWLFTR